jgi:DNA-binding transcriptional regulator YhcF (GntR family)
MSMSALRWARTVRNVDATEKLVLLLLADLANAQAQCWPSVAGMAADACIGERTAQRALAALTKAGLITRDGKGGRGLTHTYTLAMTSVERVSDEPERVTRETPYQEPERVTSEAKRVPSTTKRVTNPAERVSPVSPEPIEPIEPIEPKVTRAKAEPARVDLPAWLPADAWADWVEHRRQMRKPMSQKAAEFSIRDLGKLRAEGDDPRAVIEQAIAASWQGLYALKNRGRPQQSQPFRNGFFAVAEQLMADRESDIDDMPYSTPRIGGRREH